MLSFVVFFFDVFVNLANGFMKGKIGDDGDNNFQGICLFCLCAVADFEIPRHCAIGG